MILNYIRRIVNWSGKNLMVAACVLVVMAGLYKWSLTPHVQYLQAAENYRSSAREVEKTSKVINKELGEGRRELNEVSQRFQQGKQRFFEINTAENFLESLKPAIEKEGCYVNSLKILPTKDIEVKEVNCIDIRQYQMNLSITGQYQNIVKLLDFLQNRKQKVWVDNINLYLKDLSSGTLGCDLSLSVYALTVKEK